MSIPLPPLPDPAAEAVMDLYADHEGPVEACQYLPADTMLYTAAQMREYATQAVAAAREKLTRDLADGIEVIARREKHPELRAHFFETVAALRA